MKHPHSKRWKIVQANTVSIHRRPARDDSMVLPHCSGQGVRCMSLASGSERERENTRYKLNYIVENILLAWFLNEVIALKSAGAVSVLWWYKSSWSWRRFIISFFGSVVEGRDRDRVDIHMLMREEHPLNFILQMDFVALQKRIIYFELCEFFTFSSVSRIQIPWVWGW